MQLQERSMKAHQEEDWRPITDIDYVFDPVMIDAFLAPGRHRYVAFSNTIIWMMTDGGADRISLNSGDLWNSAVNELLSAIDSEEGKVFGYRNGSQELEVIPPLSFALAKVLPLGPLSLHEFVPYAPAYIECAPVTEANDDARSHDELYRHGQKTPAWTGLMLRTEDALKFTRRRDARLIDGMEDGAVPEDALQSNPTDEPALTEALSDPSELLQVAIDERSGDVIIRDLTRLSGRDSQLIRQLETFYRDDIAAGRTPEKHRYISAEKLADALAYRDVEKLRQRVCRCRRTVKRASEGSHSYKLSSASLIQTRRPDGYRLNPLIRFVSIKEIDSGPRLSRSKQKAVM
jgi:hypothetical protein